MPDQPEQLPTREETFAAIANYLGLIHLASCQMREATRGSYRAISESNELLAQTDKILSRIQRERDRRPVG
jgi:CHASE3 domain sensor protein